MELCKQNSQRKGQTCLCVHVCVTAFSLCASTNFAFHPISYANWQVWYPVSAEQENEKHREMKRGREWERSVLCTWAQPLEQKTDLKKTDCGNGKFSILNHTKPRGELWSSVWMLKASSETTETCSGLHSGLALPDAPHRERKKKKGFLTRDASLSESP